MECVLIPLGYIDNSIAFMFVFIFVFTYMFMLGICLVLVKLPNIFQSGCIILHLHQQCMKVSVTPLYKQVCYCQSLILHILVLCNGITL